MKTSRATSPRSNDGITDPGTGDVPPDQLRLSTTYSVDTFSPGLARFVIQIERGSGALPQGFLPKFDAVLYGASTSDQSGLRGKASLWVTVGGDDPKVALEIVDKSPLRSVNSVRNGAGTIYQLKLDARYPWRIFALASPTRLVVDIGGAPQSVSDRIAVSSPARMEPVVGAIVGRTRAPTGSQFTLSGAAPHVRGERGLARQGFIPEDRRERARSGRVPFGARSALRSRFPGQSPAT